jgi:hypothetical protein
VRDTWGAPAAGWPTFDENGRRIHPEQQAADETADTESEDA